MFSWTGFRPLYSELMGRVTGLHVIPYVIENDAVLEEGDQVKLASDVFGVTPAVAVADLIFGYCVGFVTPQGLPVSAVSDNSTLVDGTFSGDPSGDTYTAAADNVTDKKIAALVIQAFGVVCSSKLDATAGTTTGSDSVGYYLDILTTDSTQLDESTVGTGIANHRNVPSNPMDPTKATDPTDPTNRVYTTAAETQKGVETAETVS